MVDYLNVRPTTTDFDSQVKSLVAHGVKLINEREYERFRGLVEGLLNFNRTAHDKLMLSIDSTHYRNIMASAPAAALKD
jgi:hypothetical protein